MRPFFRLLLKLAVLSLPLDICLATYICSDPFRVLHHYDDFYSGHEVHLNRDYVSTEVFLRQVDRCRYDSFIFGNSRTMAFLTSDWTKWIDSQAAFHFDSSFESLFGITGKLRLIDRKGVPLRNALILLDYGTLKGTTDRYEALFVKHPEVSGNAWLPFQLTFVKAYLSPTCCLPYMAQKLFGVQIPGFRGPFHAEHVRYDPVTNDIGVQELEQQIAADPESYYGSRESEFPPAIEDSPSAVDNPANGNTVRELLEELRRILARHGTHYRIVINPLWDKSRLNPADLKVLVSLFGKERVFDFSGVNHITVDKHNYYEGSHYRQHIGREILAEIYGRPKAELQP